MSLASKKFLSVLWLITIGQHFFTSATTASDRIEVRVRESLTKSPVKSKIFIYEKGAIWDAKTDSCGNFSLEEECRPGVIQFRVKPISTIFKREVTEKKSCNKSGEVVFNVNKQRKSFTAIAGRRIFRLENKDEVYGYVYRWKAVTHVDTRVIESYREKEEKYECKIRVDISWDQIRITGQEWDINSPIPDEYVFNSNSENTKNTEDTKEARNISLGCSEKPENLLDILDDESSHKEFISQFEEVFRIEREAIKQDLENRKIMFKEVSCDGNI